MSTPTSPELSIVIPCRGMAESLSTLLDDLESQEEVGAGFEVLLVDDGTDPALSLPHQEAFPLRVLRLEGGGPAAARNAGSRQARGTYLLFLDADVRIPSTLLKAYLAAAAHTFVDRIVIVDSGSTDGAWEDALQFADTAVRVLGPIDFGHLRTVALRHAQTEWAFMLDTDEAIPVGGAELLRRIITWADGTSVDVIWQARNWIVPPSLSPLHAYRGHPFLWPDPQARLIRMAADPMYRGTIHEWLEVSAGRFACLIGNNACSLLHLKFWVTSDYERQQLLNLRQVMQPGGPDAVQLAPERQGGFLVELSEELLLANTREWLRARPLDSSGG